MRIKNNIPNIKRLFIQNHDSIDFVFEQNKDDFYVQEIPLNKFSLTGNNLILKIKKQDTSTWDLIKLISKKLNIEESYIGYAGLKDKNATTIQYISIPLNKSRDYKNINNKNIQVIETYKHNQKLKIGDLSGNRFKINLKDIQENDLDKIYQIVSQIQKHGMPNYFGYQRFGNDTTFEQCQKVVYGEVIEKNKKLRHLLTSAYQSYFFNAWLRHRIELSKEQESNKLTSLEGDIFLNNDNKTITGLMVGRKVIRSKQKARKIEELYDDMYIHEKGFRRTAWIKVENLKTKYNKEKNTLFLDFTLPKSSYATVFIENIANKNLR